MKRRIFVIFAFVVSIISFSVNVSKDTLLISINDNTWITRQIAEKVKSIGNYMYDIEIKDVMTETIKTENYDVIMNIFTNTKENITIAFGYFQGGGFRIQKQLMRL